MNYFDPKTDGKIRFDLITPKTLAMLNKAREIAGIPFIITSHYREPSHSIGVGGSGTDAHTEQPCHAFDVYADTARMRGLILKGVYQAGFNRVGVNESNGHIHFDASPKLDPDVFWIE